MKGKKPAKGFGFGDAMFAIKDVQMDYANFDQPSVPLEKPPPPPVPKKNPIAVNPKTGPRPMNPVKPTTVNRPLALKQQQQSTVPKEQFKIAPGKQFQNHVNFTPLNIQTCTKGVYELTQSKSKSGWDYNIFCDGVPADQIVDKPQVSFSFNAEDIKQGQLGNCYFVASLASLAHLPEVLRARIPNFKEYHGKTKTFKVFLFESGKCIEILVDNLFAKIYVKPVLNDISPIILEKAYAQSYGNFDVLKIGQSNDALRDLTGAPAFYLDLKDKAELRDKIKSGFANKYAMVVGSKQKTPNKSISEAHSYTILSYEMVNGQLYLLLRDPRGYTQASFSAPQQLVGIPEMGTFWVDEKNLELNFQVISVCKVRKNYSYFFKTFDKKELVSNRGGLLLNVSKPGKIYATIHQKHKKFFDQTFAYDVIKILIAEVSTKKDSFEVVKTIESDFKALQACVIEAELGPKQYIILGEIGKKKEKGLFPRQIFTLSVYSQSQDITFEQMTGNIDPRPFLISQIRQKGEAYLSSATPQGLFRFQVALFGYICMYYQNRGVKKVLEEMQYTAKNVEVTQKKVQLAPHTNKMVLHAIGPENSCSYKWSVKSKTLFT